MRPASPASRPRAPVHSRPPRATAAEHGGELGRSRWKRTQSRAPAAQTLARSWGEASSDISDPTPAISFYYPSLHPNHHPYAAPHEKPRTLLHPSPFRLQPNSHFHPAFILAELVHIFNSLQRRVTNTTWRNESRFSSLNCLILHPFLSPWVPSTDSLNGCLAFSVTVNNSGLCSVL